MRIAIATSIFSFGLIASATSANNIQLDRRQFLVGAGSLSAAPILTGPAASLGPLANPASLVERVNQLATSSRFFIVMSPREMVHVFQQVLHKNAFKDGGDILLNHPWQWPRYVAIEFVEAELEIAQKLKVPLETVQRGADDLLNLRKFIHFPATPSAHASPELGNQFFETYIQVMDRRIPGYGQSLGKGLRFLTKFHPEAPEWMIRYRDHYTLIESQMAVSPRRADLIESLNARRLAPQMINEVPSEIPSRVGLPRWIGPVRKFGQSCADLLREYIGTPPMMSDDSDRAGQLPAPPSEQKTPTGGQYPSSGVTL